MDKTRIEEVLFRDRFSRLLGIEADMDPNSPYWARMRVRADHCNGLGMVQGGALFTLADYAFALACNSIGGLAVALDVSISFLGNVREGAELQARVEEVSVRRTVALYVVRIEDEEGKVLTLFKGTAYRFQKTDTPPK